MPVAVHHYTGAAGAGTRIALSPRLSPVLFVLAALAVYWPTRHAGFVTDWLGWQYAYDRDGWAGVPLSFGYPGLHPVLHLANYTLYWLFGANSPVWYGVFAAIHGLNAWLLFRLALRLPLQVSVPQSLFIAGAASGLFLLSPYAAEAVVWRVCLHYLLAMFFALQAMHHTLDYLSRPNATSWWKIQVFVLLALFAFEWSLVIPVLLLVLVVVWYFSRKSTVSLPALAGRLIAPQAALWTVYFLLNKFVIGDWVGHYGADTHLKITPQPMMANLLRYTVKQFGFGRHWDHFVKTQVFDGLAAGWTFWLGTGIIVAGALLWLAFFRRLPARLQWSGAAFAWFFVALLPVSNLFFCYLMYSENDRYGYFATGFGWLGLALMLSFLPKILSRLVTIGLLGLSLYLLLGMNNRWAVSEQLYDDLVNRFDWYDRDEVIILGSPDNYHGVYMFRIIGKDSGFNEALELRRKKPFKGVIWEPVQFNMTAPADGIRVEADSSGLLYKVSFLQDGNWWWHSGIGATDYENDRYVFRVKPWFVEVELKEKRSGTALIYPVDGHWVEVNANDIK